MPAGPDDLPDDLQLLRARIAQLEADALEWEECATTQEQALQLAEAQLASLRASLPPAAPPGPPLSLADQWAAHLNGIKAALMKQHDDLVTPRLDKLPKLQNPHFEANKGGGTVQGFKELKKGIHRDMGALRDRYSAAYEEINVIMEHSNNLWRRNFDQAAYTIGRKHGEAEIEERKAKQAAAKRDRALDEEGQVPAKRQRMVDEIKAIQID